MFRPFRFLHFGLRRLLQKRALPSLAPSAPPASPAKDNFDAQRGVSTSPVIPLYRLDIPTRNYIHGTRHQASGHEACGWAIGSLAIPYERYTFIDLGSGLGRALLIASDFPFERIIGVEFARELAEGCRQNMRAAAKPERVLVRCMDAAKFEFERNARIVLYLYNPFNKVVLERVLTNLCASTPQDVRILYLTPDHADVFLRAGYHEQRRERGYAFLVRDQAT